MAGLRSRLASAGCRVLTFEYAYRAAGKSFPDRPPKLLAVHRAAAEVLRDEVGSNLILAGRSMGGRMSTLLAAEGEACRGLVAYGYPLHPAGKPDKLRVDHLGSITVPMLLITGSNDALALPDLANEHLAPLPTATLAVMEGANHSFRRKGSSAEEVLDELARLTMDWIGELPELG